MRNETIEKLRAFAIIIVVLGHSIIIFDPSWAIYTSDNSSKILYLLKQFINIIQMPLFIMISGFLFCSTCKKYDFLKIVKEKAKRIIAPFIFIAIFWLVPIRLVAEYKPFVECGYIEAVKRVFLGIDSGHLWYLPTLFALFVIIYVVNKIIKEKKVFIIGFGILFFILSLLSNKFTTILFVSQICEYLIYFYIGFLAAKIQEKLKFNVTAVILFVVLSILLVFVIEPNDIIFRIVKIFTAIIGTYAMYGVFTKIKTNKIVKMIDKNSFAIYLFHSPLLYIMYNNFANINPYLLASINLTIGITIPSIMAYVLRKLKLNFLIGEKIK